MSLPGHRRVPAPRRSEQGHLLRVIVLVSVVLLGAASAFWVWQGSGTSNEIVTVPEEWNEAKPEVAEPLDEGVDGREGAKPEASGEELPEALRTLYSEEVREATDQGQPLVLQVWNLQKGVPAAETDVWYMQAIDGSGLKGPFAEHWSDLAIRRGERFKTDLRGRVELPAVQRWAIVAAQRSDAYGYGFFRAKHREVESLTMHPDETVTVRVVDGKGERVAGVPVGLVQKIPVRKKSLGMKDLQRQMKQLNRDATSIRSYIQANPDQREAATAKLQALRKKQAQVKRAIGAQRKAAKAKLPAKNATPIPAQASTRSEVRARRRTDADGLAVFRHFQAYRRKPAKWWSAQHADQFEAVLMMPLQQSVSRPFQGRPVPTQTMELRLPPTGSLALRPVDQDGRPFAHPVRATLRAQGTGSLPWMRIEGQKAQDEEWIEFPFVGLHLRFEARCRLDDDDFTWDVSAMIGPNQAGERTVVDVVVAPKAGMLFGRLLDSVGRPLASLRFDFLINSAAGRLEGEGVTLDPKGQFHLPFKVQAHHRPPFRLEVRGDDSHASLGLARKLPTLPLGRVTQVGDLRMGDLERIAYGLVLDDSGKPIEGAAVKLQRERLSGGKQPKVAWHEEAFTNTLTNAEGRYELFADLEPGKYRLWSQAKDHFPFVSQGFQASAKADIELLRKSRVVGTVLTPAWLASKKVRLVLQPALAGEKQREDRVRDYQGKKYVYFDWVKPGTYSVQVRVQDFPDPILRIDRLTIQAGQMGVHPRLKDLDLRPYIHRFVITAVDGQGKPIQPKAPLLARIQRPGRGSGYVGFPWRGNRVEVIHNLPQLDVLPMFHGYRAEPALLGAGESQIRFLKIPPVRVQLPGLPQIVGKTPTWIALEMVSESGLPSKLETWDRRSGRIANWYNYLSKNGGVQMFKNDTVTIPLSRDGKYKVVVHLGTQKEIVTVKIPIGQVDVRLVPGAQPQLVRVTYDPDQIREGLAEVERRKSAK